MTAFPDVYERSSSDRVLSSLDEHDAHDDVTPTPTWEGHHLTWALAGSKKLLTLSLPLYWTLLDQSKIHRSSSKQEVTLFTCLSPTVSYLSILLSSINLIAPKKENAVLLFSFFSSSFFLPLWFFHYITTHFHWAASTTYNGSEWGLLTEDWSLLLSLPILHIATAVV